MIKPYAIALAALLTSLPAAHAATSWNKLITPAEIQSLQESADPLILDIRPAKHKKGGPSYEAGHIDGAVSAPYPKWRGPKENPGKPLDDAKLTALLQSLGVERDRPTVIVHQGRDGTDFGAAARVYWTLKSSGVSQIAILNGGINAWTAAKKPLTKKPTEPTPSTITASLSDAWMATRDDVAAAAKGESGASLLDARPLRQYLGFSKHKAAKTPGTLAGAQSFPQAQWFDHNGALMSQPAEANAIAKQAGIGPDGEIVSFCNTGHWAATNWFALSELAGYENVKMYPGSMVDWTVTGGATEKAGE